MYILEAAFRVLIFQKYNFSNICLTHFQVQAILK